MCRIEAAEPFELGTVKEHVARQDRDCDECGRTITAGERYERCSGCWDKHWTTYRTCEHCMAARVWLVQECGGWVYTEVCEELEEHWEEDSLYRTLWLARVIAGMKHQWHDGRIPIPEGPPRIAAA